MSELKFEKKLSVVPTRDSLSVVSDFLDACLEECEAPMKAGFQLKVVADEVYSNIVFYSGATSGEVVFTDEGDTMVLLFTDNGVPYNPLQADDPNVTAATEDRDIGGLGMFMVKRMAQEVSYVYADGENRLTVVMSKTPKQKKPALEDI